jgi:hypothetical protein
MSATEESTTSRTASVGKADMKLEVDIIPVSDVDRAKQFHEAVGLPARRRRRPDGRPSDRPVHSARLGYLSHVRPRTDHRGARVGRGGLIVSDIEAAHHQLTTRGIEVSDIWHGPPFPVEARQPGPDPERASYGSFFYFTDPDSNTWLVQEVTTRLPGRMNAAETGYVSAADLEGALRRAEAAHAEHETHGG